MSERRAQNIWVEQCDAARNIKARYGLAAALDYLVGEKLMTFAEAAATRAEFAQELPRFVSEIRRMFPPSEIRAHLGQIERALDYNNMETLEEDNPLCEDPDAAPTRSRRADRGQRRGTDSCQYAVGCQVSAVSSLKMPALR